MSMATTKGRKALPVILERLHEHYPDAKYELLWDTPLELLVATILAAQCTDERVNQVTRALFKKYPDARAYAEASLTDLANDVRQTGFFNEKAKAIQAACKVIVDQFGGQVPRSMEEMTTLPRVARKTANVVLTQAFNMPSGIIVDSHVTRVTQRIGLTELEKPEKIEYDLMDYVPKSEWIHFGPALVLHGRYTCTSSDPKCGSCFLESVCEKNGVEKKAAEKKTPEKQETPVAKKKPAAAAPASSPRAHGHTVHGMASQLETLPSSWRTVLSGEFQKPYFKELEKFVDSERKEHTVFPPEQDVFNAFKFTPFDEIKVLLLGQDPYHDDGQAHGLCFSVRPGIKPPPSLVNMFKELKDDLGCKIPNHGCLEEWAKQGILLLNAVLTVRAHEPNSHKDQGWEQFTDAVIRAASDRSDPVVFVLWGAYAQKKEKLIDGGKHVILKAAHPSPLSAKKFFGSKPFSAINDALRRLAKTPIDWQLHDV
jgi:uracil-DNA glycosylase